MPKPLFTFMLIMLVLASISSFAQEDENYFFKSPYSGKYYPSPYETRKDYFERSVSGRFNINNAADAQLIFDKKLPDEVTAVELGSIPTPELPRVFSLLARFPKLVYIRILGKDALNQNEKVNQLVANINNLRNLKGIEFAYTDDINMDDALKKLIPLKQLRILSLTAYNRQLPTSVTLLTQIDSVKLNTINIGDNDISGVNWTKALITGDPKSWHDASGALANQQNRSLVNLAKIKSLKNLYLYADLRYPDIISRFSQIERLSIFYENNQLSLEPFIKAVGSLNQLQHLSVNLVTDDPEVNIEGLQNLTQLSSLFLNINGERPIAGIAALGKLINLEYLAVGNSKIGALPDIFKTMPKLRSVALVSNEITKIPASLFNLPLLENLDLARNQIEYLPGIIDYGCKNLKRINLMENRLTSIPKAFEGLSQLEVINCAENKIATIPGGWEYFQNLKEVNFAINHLSRFPEGLQNNHHVERIALLFNRIEDFPDVEGEGYKLNYLGLSGIGNLFELPEHIGKYTELDTLDAEQLSLTTLPESLGDCKKLKMLLLNRSITKRCNLPAGLKDAKDLQVLYLYDNPLLDHQSIFDVILSQPRVDFRVNLSSDNIAELPSTEKWLTIPFKTLNLKDNPIATYPKEFINSKVKGEVTYPTVAK
ncbi:leucine-rich repeat domain-containing protein [Mucilaginibacter corticis]|uniref:Leucine-rich repeat domain-containing protein n=1 Tax=Mucilaginibacter corticis TaxID=2597670 RepID=A0A556MSP7_9SPHI|nr:leucine-rich repeat domain-containing protein [Mucilaginibacter corticis]TSJ42819.1 leucine-rich repeat domain-containing protein [Mucilaginibacter corticis]